MSRGWASSVSSRCEALAALPPPADSSGATPSTPSSLGDWNPKSHPQEHREAPPPGTGLQGPPAPHVPGRGEQDHWDSPGVVAVLHCPESHRALTDHMDKGPDQVLHEGSDHAEVGPPDAGGSIHQEHDVGRIDIDACPCKATISSSGLTPFVPACEGQRELSQPCHGSSLC